MVDLQSSLALQTLQENIEGVQKRISRKPLMFMTVHKFELKETGSVNVREFCLEGLRVDALLEIPGSQKQILKDVGQEAARRIMNKAKSKAPFSMLGKKRPPPEIKAAPATSQNTTLIGQRQDPGSDEPEEEDDRPDAPKVQTAQVQMTMKITKVAGNDKLVVKIKELSVGQNTFTSQKMAKRILHAPGLRTIIESGVSKLVSKSMSKKLVKEKTRFRDKMKNRFCFVCVSMFRVLTCFTCCKRGSRSDSRSGGRSGSRRGSRSGIRFGRKR